MNQGISPDVTSLEYCSLAVLQQGCVSWRNALKSAGVFGKEVCLALLTEVAELVLQYRSTTNLSITAICSSEIFAGVDAKLVKTSVISGKTDQMFHAVTFPLPAKNETVSQPVPA